MGGVQGFDQTVQVHSLYVYPVKSCAGIALDTVEKPVRVTVWSDAVAAYDMGDLCAQWFGDFLGTPLRLARFDPEQKRLSARRWTGSLDVENAFADGFPVLVTSTAALDELNRRLLSAGHAPVTMARFRPNLVLSGLDAHGEEDRKSTRLNSSHRH